MPCSACGGSGYDDDSKSGALCPRGCRPPGWVDAGALLRAGVAAARMSWAQLFRLRWSQRTHRRRIHSQWMPPYMAEHALLQWREASWQAGVDRRSHYALTIVQVGRWRVSLM